MTTRKGEAMKLRALLAAATLLVLAVTVLEAR